MMMKKFKKVLFGGVALSAFTLVAVSPAFAAEVVSERESTASVKITAGDTETGDGSLAITNVSESLNFGEQALSNTEAVFKTNEEAFVEVTDLRGSGNGWTLQVASSKFVNEKGQTLKGATIEFPEGAVKPEGYNPSSEPTPHAVTLGTDGTEAATNIMTAYTATENLEAAGMGTWRETFAKESVELHVPAGNYAGEYKATLTWTLTDAPQ